MTPPLFSDAAPARKRSAWSWSADETQFADWLLKTWNETVGKVGGRAFNVRGNRGEAVRFYRRIQESTASTPSTSSIFTPAAIRAALAAYAENPNNVKIACWKTFRWFFHEGEDLISKQLARIGYSGQASSMSPHHAAAQKLHDHLRLGYFAGLASQTNHRLADYISSMIYMIERRKLRRPGDDVQLQNYQHLADLIRRSLKIPSAQLDQLDARAHRAFEALRSRPARPGDLADENDRAALMLAIFDRETPKTKSTNPSQEKK